jgi:D-glycero-D-manno-heptose 1,7-bisphosphate phosphatase
MTQKAVFLDRDGVINNGDLYYTYRKEDFKFNPDIFEALSLLVKKDYLLIVITNQGGIAKGIYEHKDVQSLHTYMIKELQKKQIAITEIYYCPHHDTISSCICRKPDSGNIEKAIARFHINIKKSYMIGDSERDILAGQKVGLKTFKINKNESILNLCKKIVEK